MSTVKTIGNPIMEFVLGCLDCKVYHRTEIDVQADYIREMEEWNSKHPGHRTEFFSPRREIPRDLDDYTFDREGIAPWWLEHREFKPNANIKLAYAAAATLTFTSLNSLASDATLLQGASALAVDNTSNLYLDYALSGAIVNSNTTPTVGKEIDVYLYRAITDGPVYPDTLLGTDALITMTSQNIINSSLKLAAQIIIAATASQVNYYDAGNISQYFGGLTPSKWSTWVVHNSGQAILGSGNQQNCKGSYVTSI